LLALAGAFVIAMTLMSAPDAQTAQGRNGARPFTAAEKLWFQIPEAPERVN
jgi:hypothetical protein